MTLTRAHELLIVATDGVWDAVTESEAVNLVGDAATVAAGCQQARALQNLNGVVVRLFGHSAAPTAICSAACDDGVSAHNPRVSVQLPTNEFLAEPSHVYYCCMP